MKRTKYFKKLNYSLGDEDSAIEMELLPFNLNLIGVIAGSGGRVIPLLAKSPKEIFCYDVVKEQLYLTELRIEALRKLSYEQYLGFLGYPKYNYDKENRKLLFDSLNLSSNAKVYLEYLLNINEWKPIIYYGNFEKTLIGFSKIIRFFLGKKGLNIFDCPDLKDQQDYYKNKFPRFRWKSLVFILGSSAILNSILYKGDFPKKNIKKSSYEIYNNIFSNLFNNFQAKSSFFLQLLFFGEIKYSEGNAIECDHKIFFDAKESLKNIEIHYINKSILESVNTKFSFLSISDVPSFFNQNDEKSFLQQLVNILEPNSLVVVRAHLRLPNAEYKEDYDLVTNKYSSIISKDRTQLWNFFVYQKK